MRKIEQSDRDRKRYAWRMEQILVPIKKTDGTFSLRRSHCVTLEEAHDLDDISLAKGDGCVWNSYPINKLEYGACGKEGNLHIYHGILLSEEEYLMLLKYSLPPQRLYAVDYVTECALRTEGNRVLLYDYVVPKVPFDRKAHKRYMQASESYICAFRRSVRTTRAMRALSTEVLVDGTILMPEICNISQ